MTETSTLGLPLVQAAQAQKHVTVNEAFARLDALTQMVLTTIGGNVPPGAPADGEVHAVGAGATGDWSGFDGLLALWLNNGWVGISPVAGWRAWSVGDGAVVTFDGVDWVPGLAALGASGGALVTEVVEIDHDVTSGGTSVVSGALPVDTLIYGVSARVISGVGGAASLDIGVAGDDDRFAVGLDTALGAVTSGIRTAPTVYPGGADLVLTAVGGSFDGTGTVRLAIHAATLRAPRG